MDLEEQYVKLLRYCYMKLRDRTLAEDITQETFIKFFESKSYHDMGKEMAYLYTIAGNLCTDSFRRHRAELTGDIFSVYQKELLTKDTEQDITDRISIESAMDKLNAEEREIVMLRFSSDLSITDIGKIMNISRFAVRRRLSAALGKLREELEK